MKVIYPVNKLQGSLRVPGDKSISHRAVMLGSLAEGTSRVRGFLKGADCLSTINCFRQMGIRIEEKGDVLSIYGKGLKGLTAPEGILDVGNSGTTTRLISGILAGQPFETTLSGDQSLNSRPMKRIMDPLTQMGAHISSLKENGCAPLRIRGHRLHGIDYRSPVASAQVKSCLLLAGLYADGPVKVTEPARSRDHTERMLKAFGADIRCHGKESTIIPPAYGRTGDYHLHAREIMIPGDISSAAYFIAAGLIVPDSCIEIRNVGINDTRAGILSVCRDMGADIRLLNRREESGEPVADILIRSSRLHGTVIEGDIIPTLIDELPVIAMMACFAEGETIIRDARELKVKESDRITIVSDNLKRMGADVTPAEDGFIIRGKASRSGSRALKGARISCANDHRIAMTFAIAGLCADGETLIEDPDCVDISYPDFFRELDGLIVDSEEGRD